MQQQIDDELLVAYLDGELPSDQQATIEQNLHTDEELQRRVACLRASWQLLGELPMRKPRQDLVQSTIEIVTLAMEKEAQSWPRRLMRNRWLTLTLSGFVMFFAGALFSRTLTHYLTRQILANLPAIVEYRSLQNIDSVEFLDKLVEIPNLAAAVRGDARPALIGDGLVPRDIAERRSWVENLEDVDRGRLESNLIDFGPLPDERKEQLRSIAERIYSRPERTVDYLTALRAYSALLDNLGTKRSGVLQAIDSIDERVAAVEDRVAVLMAEKHELSSEDRFAIRAWLSDLQYKEENYERMLYYDFDSLVVGELVNGDIENSFVTATDVEDLISERLSPPAAQLLQALENDSLKRFHLGFWVNSVLRGPPNATDGTAGAATADIDLRERFANLPKESQDELEFLPEDEVRSALRKDKSLPPPSR